MISSPDGTSVVYGSVRSMSYLCTYLLYRCVYMDGLVELRVLDGSSTHYYLAIFMLGDLSRIRQGVLGIFFTVFAESVIVKPQCWADDDPDEG